MAGHAASGHARPLPHGARDRRPVRGHRRVLRHLPRGIDEYLELMAARENSSGWADAARSDRARAGDAPVRGKSFASEGAVESTPASSGSDASGGAAAAASTPKLSGGEQRTLRKLMASNEKKVETLKGKIEQKARRHGLGRPDRLSGAHGGAR